MGTTIYDMRERISCLMLIGLGCAGASIGCNNADRPQHDELADSTTAVQTPASSQAESLVAKHLELVRSERLTDGAYYRSNAGLRAQPRASVAALRRHFDAAHPLDHLDRWDIADTLAGLNLDEAVPELSRIVRQPLPERGGNPEDDIQEREVAVRARAISGLGYLAARDNAEAIATLKETFRHVNPAMRRTAVQAYLTWKNTPERIAEVKAVLSPEEHWMLKVGHGSREPNNPPLGLSSKKSKRNLVALPAPPPPPPEELPQEVM